MWFAATFKYVQGFNYHKKSCVFILFSMYVFSFPCIIFQFINCYCKLKCKSVLTALWLPGPASLTFLTDKGNLVCWCATINFRHWATGEASCLRMQPQHYWHHSGLEPTTFRSWIWRPYQWAIEALISNLKRWNYGQKEIHFLHIVFMLIKFPNSAWFLCDFPKCLNLFNGLYPC